MSHYPREIKGDITIHRTLCVFKELGRSSRCGFHWSQRVTPDATAIKVIISIKLLLILVYGNMILCLFNADLAYLIGVTIATHGGPFGPIVVVGLLYLVTSLLTELMSNNSAAIVLAQSQSLLRGHWAFPRFLCSWQSHLRPPHRL